MKKNNRGILQASRLILSFIAISISLMAVTPASAAITNLQAWSLVYGGAAYPGIYTYNVPAGSNRLLVVAVSSTRSTAGTQTPTVAYGGQGLTLAVGDAATSAQQHSYLFYLNEAGIAAAANTNLVVTVTGGTSLYNNVYASVYAGVDQTTPITNSRNFNHTTANTAVGPFATALTIASGDLAVEIINITRTNAGAAHTITGWAANWSSVIGPNSAPADPTRQTAYVATNSTAGSTTSQHTASGNCRDSMSAMTLKAAPLSSPVFTSASSTQVVIGLNPTFRVTAAGFPTPTLSLTGGSLPTGMTFTPATGILSGAPAAGTAGTYSLTFTAANGVLPDATQSFTLTVLAALNYRKCHVINAGAGTGTHYQMRVTVHYGAGTDSGENVYLNSLCKTDFGDIRFVSSNGINELDYWMETKTDGVSAVFWVEVLDDLSSVNRTIYMYYGNAAATTTSNENNTFLFFDHFNGNLSKWVVEKTLNSSSITINAAQSYVRCGGGIQTGTYGHTSLGSSPTYSGFQNNALEYRYRVNSLSISEVGFRGTFYNPGAGYKARSDQRAGQGQSILMPPYYTWGFVGGTGDGSIPTANAWYRGAITASGTNLNYYRDNLDGVLVSRRTATDATHAGPGEIALQNHYGPAAGGGYSDYDWVAVRKFTSTEPTHGAWAGPVSTPTDPNAAPAAICAGGSSTLSATVGGGEVVDWYTGSCGGTAVPGGASPSVSPAVTTTYYARARNTTTGCSSALCASVTVTVNALPATPTGPTAAPAAICAGGSSTLSATVGGGEVVDWYTGSCGVGLVGSGTSLVVTPASTTTYHARARNTTTGCVSTSCAATVTVTVVTALPATPTSPLADPAAICAGSSSTLTASVGGGETVDWYSTSCGVGLVGSGTSLVVTPASTTTYYARARNTTTGCVSTSCAATVTVTVVTALPATPTSPLADPAAICAGSSSTLTASVGGGETVDWYSTSCGVGLVGSGTSLVVTPASTTTYYARARNTATGCSSAACAFVTVTVNPNAAIVLTSGAGTDAQTLLINTALTDITYSVTGGGTGAGVTGLPAGVSGAYNAGIFTISGTPTAAGTFNYTVTTTGTCTQVTATGTITITVTPTPTAFRRAVKFVQNDTTDDDITVVPSGNTLDLTGVGTIEAWIYPTSFETDAGIIVKGADDVNTLSYGFGLAGGTLFGGGTARNIGFVLYDSANNKHTLVADDYDLAANKWHHVACVWDVNAANKMIIYINGIQETPLINSLNSARINSDDLIIGLQNITPGGFSGVIDEVRIWNTARTEDGIRDDMCRKVALPDPNLMVCYLRFDEDSGDAGDTSGNNNIGTITNATRICSSAPVGDDSDPDYGPGFNPTLSVGDESLTATINPGSVVAGSSGIHVYRVNDAPDYRSGPLQMRLFPDRGYWGVFVTGGAAPRYDVEYKYDVSNNGIAGVGREENLRLAFRHGNCEIWKDLSAELDTGAGVKTLTKEGMTGTEYILGIEIDPRNTIAFDGTDDYVLVEDNVDDGDLDLTMYGAIEAWINISGYQDNAGIICKGDGANASYSLYMGPTGSNDLIVFTVDDLIGNTGTITSTTTLDLGTWYHIAGTWDSNTAANNMKLYINGVQEGAVNAISAGASNADVYIGYRPVAATAGNFFGLIDEVRIWKISDAANMRNQTLIRDTMCRKLAGNETDLGGYWRFDEETGSISCPDYSGNGNVGTMNTTNPAPGFADIRASRVCSSAPIGDDSDWDYSVGGSGGIVSAQVAHPVDGDYMIAEESGGNWTTAFSGIHVYRIDEPPVYPPDLWNTPPYTYVTPNGMTPPAGPPAWSSVDYYRHWGVFVTDWDDTNAPTYDVIYNYLGNPMVPLTADGTPGNPELGLAKRTDYCVACRLDVLPCPVWVDSGADWDPAPAGVGELRLLGANGKAQSQYGTPPTPPTNPEYILGGINQPLAITLAFFTATVNSDGCVEIEWETATEIDTIGFYLWRGMQRDGAYEMIPNSYTRSKSLMETMGARYAYTDCEIDFTVSDRYYYKLEEVEAGPTESRHFYGPYDPVSDAVGASQTTGSTRSKDDNACFISAMQD